MQFVVGVVGKPRDASLAGAIREYETRAGRYWPLEFHEVREEPARSGSADLVRQREGERLLAAIPPGVQVVTCELNGRAMSSEQFSRWLQDFRERARDVAILIGGAFGLGDVVKQRA
ncbi:MAG: 23S rRNA (pseudouridine(1915)-N(3))-methyltransferase RlmH, partial [Gemmatimonadaceae bacterium]